MRTHVFLPPAATCCTYALLAMGANMGIGTNVSGSPVPSAPRSLLPQQWISPLLTAQTCWFGGGSGIPSCQSDGGSDGVGPETEKVETEVIPSTGKAAMISSDAERPESTPLVPATAPHVRREPSAPTAKPVL